MLHLRHLLMERIKKISAFAGKTFAIWVLLFACLAYNVPHLFTWIGPYIPFLLGIIMFGMGLTLTLNDFKAIFSAPKGAFIGSLAQYTVMPSLAYGLAAVFNLNPEVAVGVILVGCCPGGTASNVMTYLARGNTALSVTITSISTTLSPLLTPLLILLFARKWISVSFLDMFLSIAQIVVIPIVLGILIRRFFPRGVKKSVTALPLLSVIGIVAVASAVVALSKDNIAVMGLLIFIVVILHNILGLLMGLLIARIGKLDFKDQKAISIEVGMQNSGLGAALAIAHFSPIAAVPSAFFSVWHNISGPILATYWAKTARRHKSETQPKA